MKIKIELDEFPENPLQDWESGVQFVCREGRYQIGDNPKKVEEAADELKSFLTRQKLQEILASVGVPWMTNTELWNLKKDDLLNTCSDVLDGYQGGCSSHLGVKILNAFIDEARGVTVLPLYIYDHSGRTISTTPFSSPWDSWQLGYVFAKWNDHSISDLMPTQAKTRAQKHAWVKEHILSVVAAYNAYLTGQIYRWTIYSDFGEVLESYGGYTAETACRKDAEAALAHLTEKTRPNPTDTASLLQRWECDEPRKPGMYLQLFHGRKDPEKDMDSWGEPGPFFGPLKNVHVAYATTYILETETENVFVGDEGSDEPLRWYQDMLFYKGRYYGDFNLTYIGESR